MAQFRSESWGRVCPQKSVSRDVAREKESCVFSKASSWWDSSTGRSFSLAREPPPMFLQRSSRAEGWGSGENVFQEEGVLRVGRCKISFTVPKNGLGRELTICQKRPSPSEGYLSQYNSLKSQKDRVIFYMETLVNHKTWKKTVLPDVGLRSDCSGETG